MCGRAGRRRDVPELPLPGCAPEPLMGYLKALGVFRLVAEQADPAACLFWAEGAARLTSILNREGLTNFFLNQYRPTPIVTPWNSASGFAPTKESNKAPKDKEAKRAVAVLRSRQGPRFALYAESIRAIEQIQRPSESDQRGKERYLAQCRATLPDEVIPWLDCCFAMTQAEVKPGSTDHFPFDLNPSPLLGSGGNDGVTDFGSLYMQRVLSALPSDEPALIQSETGRWLTDSLFGGFCADGSSDPDQVALPPDTIGQFNPGAIGGANGIQGNFEAKSRANPWDYVLMMEGVLLLAGAVARRLGSHKDKAVFPFTVESVIVDNGSFSEKEARTIGKEPPSTGELWLPLWDRESTIAEVKRLFAEGRAQLGRRQARNSVEFALSVCTLGVSYGIGSFARYGFLRRNGKAFLAIPLGHLKVHSRPQAQLLNDSALVSWLDRLRDACRENDGKKDKVPARYKVALRHVDRAMFTFANRSEQGNDHKHLAAVLAAVGRAERTLAGGLRFAKEKYIRPLQRLSAQWLEQADDHGPEFGLAAAIASVRASKKGEVGPLRVYLEEVELAKVFNWSPGSTSAVWSNRPLAANLAAVFRRRQMEAFRGGLAGVPLRSARPARLDDVLAFLHGDTDDDKLADLLWGLIAIDWPKVEKRTPERSRNPVPTQFGIPRLVVSGASFKTRRGEGRPHWALAKAGGARVTPDPDVFHILATGQDDAIDVAVTRAARRLRSDGLNVTGYRNRQQAGKPLNVSRQISAERLLAAMLFPLSIRDLSRIANTVLYPPEPEERS